MNPRSGTVKLKLLVMPAVDAEIFWGPKRLAKAGRDPVEIERPRGSGPLDLEIRAAGFAPYHTRLFTDRDDRLAVRLVRAGEAAGLPGFRPAAAGARGR